MKKKKVHISDTKLIEEWDFEKNVGLSPDKITTGSHKKVWWKCSKGHSWDAVIFNRARDKKPSGCSECSKVVRIRSYVKSIQRKKNLGHFEHLLCEYDYDKNPLLPENVSYGSNKKVWWMCCVCGYNWEAAPYHRTNIKSSRGCPNCGGKVVTDNNRLSLLFPELLKEWDYSRNVLSPDEVAVSSHKEVWWLCDKCKISYRMSISSRTRKDGRGCNSCAGKVVTDNNRLSILFPGLLKEWDFIKNKGFDPGDFTYGSHEVVGWVCPVCDTSWDSSIKNRTLGNTKCPKCSRGSISNASQEWLNSLGVKNVLGVHREVLLTVGGIKYKVDGFDKKTNTVYEFFGDYWHGNPEIYNKNEEHPVCGKTFGQLYDETKTRIFRLEAAGYKVVYVWEKDYLNGLMVSKTKGFSVIA